MDLLPAAAASIPPGEDYPIELRVYMVLEYMDRGNLQVRGGGGVFRFAAAAGARGQVEACPQPPFNPGKGERGN